MVRLIKLFLCILLMFSFGIACANQESNNDYLYSEEYFDYLIECAQLEANSKLDEEQFDEIDLSEELSYEEEIVVEDDNVFKLHITKDANIKPYSETYKRENTKTIIPVGSKVSIFQNTTQYKNKYNSTDYRVLGGLEFNLHRFFDVQSGIETSYRGLDQNPLSRKLYITPQLNFSNRITLSFPNKIDIATKTSDHDVRLGISPFKSDKFDVALYASVSRKQHGQTSRSINFTTNFNF